MSHFEASNRSCKSAAVSDVGHERKEGDVACTEMASQREEILPKKRREGLQASQPSAPGIDDKTIPLSMKSCDLVLFLTLFDTLTRMITQNIRLTQLGLSQDLPVVQKRTDGRLSVRGQFPAL